MASITLTFSAAHATRIQAALEETLRLETATLDDLKAYIVQDVRNLTTNSEKRVAQLAATGGIVPVDIT